MRGPDRAPVEAPSAGALRLIPLGGLGEIGMNCLALEQRGRGGEPERLLIDCGATFPHDDYGVELFHPRFDALTEVPIAGVVLTHGHEDHIGAVPYLFRALGKTLPVYGTPYALALCRMRLGEHRLEAPLEAIEPGTRFEVGSFVLEPVRVTHSIPQAVALCIETQAGRVIHSGDFKLDRWPRDGEPTDEDRLQALGDEGVALLMSDSTNVLERGRTGSERDVAGALERVIGGARGRVVVGMFASNCHRLDAVAQAARLHERRLCLLGRSVHNHANVGREVGVLSWPSDLLVSAEVAARRRPSEVVYVASGTQGEWRGAMRRIASGAYPSVRLERGDLAVFASRIIPGNERQVHAMMNDLVAQGIGVHTHADDPAIHVSGHAYLEEQRRMLELVRPHCFVPLHGTRMHLERHAALARELGVEDPVVLENGQTATLEERRLTRGREVRAGMVASNGTMALDDEVLRQRRQLGRAGIVTLAVDVARREPVVAVAVRGLPDPDATSALAARAARHALASDRGDLRGLGGLERIRRVVRATLGESLGRRPLVEVVQVREADPPAG